MPWGRLHDGANSSGKLLALSDGAYRMWACGLVYCQANLTDGFIPDYAVMSFGVRAKNTDLVVDELCSILVVGKSELWHRVTGGYQVHDYLDWNDSREDVLYGRRQSKERLQRWREQQRSGVRNGVSNGVENESGSVYEDDVRDGPSTTTPTTTTTSTTTPSKERSEIARATPERPLIDGREERRHGQHSRCYRDRGLCVTPWVWDELLGRLGGDRTTRTQRLGAWMDATVSALRLDESVGDVPDTWWRKKFSGWVGVEATPVAGRGNASRDAMQRVIAKREARRNGGVS